MSKPQYRRVILITGPPGAGKTTLAHSFGFDVYDRDEPKWRSEQHFIKEIAAIGRDMNAQAVVIRTGATARSRRRTASIIGATDSITLDTDAQTCMDRIRSRGTGDIARQIAGVRKWWATYAEDQRGADVAEAERARRQRYGPEYRAVRRNYEPAVRRGEVDCAEPLCLEERDGRTRAIPPDADWDLCHDPSGTVILGPGHRRCNRSEAAVRGNQSRVGPQTRSWAL